MTKKLISHDKKLCDQRRLESNYIIIGKEFP